MTKRLKFESALFLGVVGENILAHREASGLSQADLARSVGVSANFIDRLERGRGNVRILTLEKVAVVLGTGLAMLLETSGTEIGHAVSLRRPRS